MVGSSELKFAEGTTQGDPLAMSMYAISLQPFISLLHNRNTAKQYWIADDATGAGPLEEVKQWWDELRDCLLYTSPSPRDGLLSRMPSSA